MWRLVKLNLCKILRFLRTLIAEVIEAGKTATYKLLLLACALKVVEAILFSGVNSLFEIFETIS